MAPSPTIRPFAGLRYARADLSGVIAPPYDIITPDERERLCRLDPDNVVRVELSYTSADARQVPTPPTASATGKTDPAGTGAAGCTPAPGGAERYEQAARTLQAWREQGILRYDERACLYPCAHEFTVNGRKLTRMGVLCAVRLTPFEERAVLPHEGTLRGPREDRRLLMLACQAQISPVFALHDDPQGQAAALISEMMGGEPDAYAETDTERHRLWRRPADELVERYCRLVAEGPLFIADGHHRYETALTVSRELRQAHPEAPAEAAFNYVLALLCPAHQPGVIILPTHRLLRLQSRQEWARLEGLIEEHFTRQPVACDVSDPLIAAHTLVDALEEPGQRALLGLYTQSGGCALLSAKAGSLPADSGPGGYNELPTVLVHRLVVDPLLGPEQVAQRVDYVTGEAEAVRRVTAGDADCALFLRPTTVAQMERVAQAGLRMPGKSTYFYPKAPTGLVIADISPERAIR